ncbi:MAG TPA: glycosyl transferase [Candidatus Omnitrophica bacterium]|nr:MAG: glycosyl transferase [Omnitrophica WOR_2 bacterium GWA2_45_18]OGX18529.1 MAG: glycosyl transferase [Omnitrophica WOR_2 bacterium GWC2_45_7]HBR15312.1 glycosyl transferase [Candidatus Omnitrophota bacterium]
MNEIVKHYDALASTRDQYRDKNKYYYALLHEQYAYLIPPGKKVLEVGCGTGELLKAFNPSVGYGVDISPEMVSIARQKFPQFSFQAGEISELKTDEKFDYIILSGLLGELDDIQEFLRQLKKFCVKDTRIIIEYYSYFWQYLLKVGERLKLKIPQKIQNWLTSEDIKNFLTLTDYDLIKVERCILIPKNIWGISYFINRFVAKLPVFNALTLNHFIVARPVFGEERECSVTILVPCRNEKGNIEQAVVRTPVFGKKQEFIFVEGGSKDGTFEEVQRVIQKYPRKDIRLYKQTGKGKGDAVRLGFSQAAGELLMILDADLTVSPEDLPKFYEAIKKNKGEYVHGSRLVYPMEKEAMRFLNLLANKFFGILFSWLLGQRFKDTLCGTKVLFRHHYQEIAAQRAYFGDFDPFGDFDLIFGATKLNLKMIEIPIRYKERRYGTTQIQRFRHGLLLLKMCFFAMKKIKFR